jgi:hypothetical protein
MKVTRMQGRRMHAHQRDRVAGIIVNGYHRVPLGIIMIANRSGQLLGESDEVLARIKMIDRDCTDQTRRRLLERGNCRRRRNIDRQRQKHKLRRWILQRQTRQRKPRSLTMRSACILHRGRASDNCTVHWAN